MLAKSRIGTFVIGACLLSSCSKKDEKAEPSKATAEEKTEPAADEKKEEKKPPKPERIKRDDETFTLKLTGPAFPEGQTFEFDPESVRINVIANRSAVQYVREGQPVAKSQNGSEIIMTQVQFGGSVAGDYEADDKRNFVVVLGVETAGERESLTLHLDSGKLSAELVSQSPKEIKANFAGKLKRTNKGQEEAVYDVEGQLNLIE
jgi:hypothetical protein